MNVFRTLGVKVKLALMNVWLALQESAFMVAFRSEFSRRADAAKISFGHVGSLAVGLVLVIVGGYVALTVLAQLLPTWAGSVKNISQNFSTADWGNVVANSLGSPLSIVISLGGMFAFLGLVFGGIAVGNYLHKGGV